VSAPNADGPYECPAVSFRGPAFALWRDSGFGSTRSEKAAWIVQSRERGATWVRWPSSGVAAARERWKGERPSSALGIVHTHPDTVDPRPSRVDAETARKQGLPIFTVSRAGIWKVSPLGETTRIDGDTWWEGCAGVSGCARTDGDPLQELGATPSGC
jgi:hypothetical protein